MRGELSADRGIPGYVYSVQFSTRWKHAENWIFADIAQCFRENSVLDDSNGVMRELRIGYNICVFIFGRERKSIELWERS